MTGAIYALVALGLTLIYGVLHIINFAHGALLTAAMFAAFFAHKLFGFDPYIAAAGLTPALVMVNAQQFTKTANCWGVDNNAKGTNTNRIVVFRKGT